MKRIVILALAAISATAAHAQGNAVLATFGLITDTHVCDKADQSNAISMNASPRYFSGGLPKIEAFAKAMNDEKADFVVSLGDFTDNPANTALSPEQRRKAALGFLESAESRLSLFTGYRYHAFGNHDTDQASKEDVVTRAPNSGIGGLATYYSFDRGGVHFLVVDAGFKSDGTAYSGVPGTPGAGYTWDDANLPEAELSWIKSDIARTKLPIIVFSHQELGTLELVDASYSPMHTVKNAAALRSALESSGKVLAVFSGHYHDGGYQEINGIPYIVLQANAAYGNDVSYHNQYAAVKVIAEGGRYTVAVAGHGMQKSYVITRTPGAR